ncbi:MAG: hypothetical protein GY737_19120 [Desulfobacteraceae bacterium]|nr:hypothetical protein [Desulfobacteraceae bacterium]
MCEAYWDTYKNDCSGFVKAVASELGIQLTGLANNIVDQILKTPWEIANDGKDANAKALHGNLLIGGLKAIGHGHVVIVVSGLLAHNKYPSAYWGSIGGVAQKNKTINWSWNKKDRDKVIYAWRRLP